MWRAIAVVLALGLAGCSARSTAYSQGRQAAERGELDEAVRLLELAASEAPDDVEVRVALIHARTAAAHWHRSEARRLLDAEELELAADELERSLELDPTNRYVREELAELTRRLREGPPPPSRPADDGLPDTLLNLEFVDTSLQVVLETLAELSGVNILFDEAYRDVSVTIELKNVTFAEALDLLTQTHGLFYKVERSSAVSVVRD